METYNPYDLFIMNPYHTYNNLLIEEKKNIIIVLVFFMISIFYIIAIIYFKNNNNNIKDDHINYRDTIKDDNRIKKIEKLIKKYETRNNRKLAFVFDDNIYDNLKVNCDEVNIYKYIIRIDEVGDFYKVLAKDKRNVDLVFHAIGGSIDTSDTCSKIIHSIKNFKEVRAIIPFYAKSAATFLALSCHKIIMSPYAVLGNTDPQIEWNNGEQSGYNFSYTDFKFVFDFIEGTNIDGQLINEEYTHDVDSIDPYFLSLAKNSQREYEENIFLMKKFIKGKTEKEEQENIIVNFLGSGKATHSRSHSREDLISMGLKIEEEYPDMVNDILQLIVEI